MNRRRNELGRWIAVGAVPGGGMDVVMHNIAVGVGVGIALGALIGFRRSR